MTGPDAISPPVAVLLLTLVLSGAAAALKNTLSPDAVTLMVLLAGVAVMVALLRTMGMVP